MDRRIGFIILVIGATLLGAVICSYSDRTVSQDPHLQSFSKNLDPDDDSLTWINSTTVGPWTVERGAVFPEEELSVLEDDAFVLVPGSRNGSVHKTSLTQQVDLSGTSKPTVYLKGRNAALLKGSPVTYWKEYCADTNVTVKIYSTENNLSKQISRSVSHDLKEISLEASQFSGQKSFIEVEAGPGPTPCGINRTNSLYISYFGVKS